MADVISIHLWQIEEKNKFTFWTVWSIWVRLSQLEMENQHQQQTGVVLGVNGLSQLPMEDNSNRHQPQRVSRFSIQRMDTADIVGMMPRRRSSVNHGQSLGSRSEFVASSYVTMDDINVAKHVGHPSAIGRSGSFREPPSKGFFFLFFHFKSLISNEWFFKNRINLLPSKLDQNRYVGAFKAHLRDSVRTTRTLQHHLSRETLPSVNNYNPHSTPNRATLDELHLGGELHIQQVNNLFSTIRVIQSE